MRDIKVSIDNIVDEAKKRKGKALSGFINTYKEVINELEENEDKEKELKDKDKNELLRILKHKSELLRIRKGIKVGKLYKWDKKTEKYKELIYLELFYENTISFRLILLFVVLGFIPIGFVLFKFFPLGTQEFKDYAEALVASGAAAWALAGVLVMALVIIIQRRDTNEQLEEQEKQFDKQIALHENNFKIQLKHYKEEIALHENNFKIQQFNELFFKLYAEFQKISLENKKNKETKSNIDVFYEHLKTKGQICSSQEKGKIDFSKEYNEDKDLKLYFLKIKVIVAVINSFPDKSGKNKADYLFILNLFFEGFSINEKVILYFYNFYPAVEEFLGKDNNTTIAYNNYIKDHEVLQKINQMKETKK